jgi:hypothetical protein
MKIPHNVLTRYPPLFLCCILQREFLKMRPQNDHWDLRLLFLFNRQFQRPGFSVVMRQDTFPFIAVVIGPFYFQVIAIIT